MFLFQGQPTNKSGRLDIELRTYDFLDSLNIEYTGADHDAAMTMDVCAKINNALNVKICKNLFLCNRQKTVYYLLMMPGDKPFKTKDLSAQLKIARLSFGDEEKMFQLLGLHPGSVSVLGLMNDLHGEVSLIIDKEILDDEYFGCHPCMNTSSLKLKTSDLINKFLPAVNHNYTVVEL